MADLAEPDLADEAGLAAMTIAEKLAASNPKLASETADQGPGPIQEPEHRQARLGRCAASRPAPDRSSRIGWSAAPSPRAGAIGATALFDVAVRPREAGGEGAMESPAAGRRREPGRLLSRPGELRGVSQGASSSRRRIANAALLLGSDDGVKAWLNGAVVFSNNTDRGDVPDQDMAPIELKKGANDLMLKITQGGGGWSAHARIVGSDGQPIAGLRVEPQAGVPLEAIPAPAQRRHAAPKPADVAEA